MAKLTIDDHKEIQDLDVETMCKTAGGRRRFNDLMEDFESQDKLGNFEIQDLMSRYNQAESLSSSILKKKDDTGNATIGKI